MPCGRRPVERAVGTHLAGEVDNVALADRVVGSEVGGGQAVEIPHRVEGGLFFKAIHARAGMQNQLGDQMIGWGRRTRHAHACEWIRRDGCVLKVTRKYFAVTGANERVCSVEPALGMSTTT